MKRELIVDCRSGGMRAAVLEDGELVELHMEGGEPDRQTETLYYGRIQAVRPSVHAAFVEIGQELNAFLRTLSKEQIAEKDRLCMARLMILHGFYDKA